MSNPPDPEQRPDAEAPEAEGRDDQAATPEEGQATVKLTPEEVQAITEDRYPSDPDDPLVGTLLRNKWRVLGRIGAGSFGTVYKVKDVAGEWIEALKILSVDRLRGPDADAMRKRFLREAQIMKKLGSRSPHIVGLSTYEDDLESGLIYFLMEHVEGRILSEVLMQDGPLSPDRAVRIGLQTCDALIAAHENDEPVVHRDLKLENLMLTTDRDGDESIKVLDFGIAKIAEREGDSRLTAAGTLGTPGYAAPEQLRAEQIDGRTDLFAFGVILYSLVTGKNPWLGHLAYLPTNQTYELMAASDRAEVIPVEKTGVSVPEELEAIIMKLLKREPDERFQSARELREALREFAGLDVSGTGTLGLTQELTPRRPAAGAEPERRLAAVWFADLVGYSTLSSQDEEAALALLDTFHKTARRVIEAGGGRVVQFIGDAVFAEFSSTQRAVVTARDFQEAYSADTAESPFSALLRIGVHVGDVLMAADGDVFGDGVNIAARIQNEAEPGQILVSQDVWRQLKQRRDFGFVAIGERSLKGIGAPVSLFAVVEAGEVTTTGELGVSGDPTTGLPTYDGTETAPGSGTGRVPKIAAAVVLLLVVGGGAYAAMNMGAGGDRGSDVGTAEVTPPPGPNDEDPTTVAGGGEPPAPDPGDDPVEPVEGDPPAATDAPQVETPPTTTTTPPQPEPTETPPALQEPFNTLAAAVGQTRSQARTNAHAALQARLGDAESLWTRAQGRASSGDYAAAIDDLDAAAPIYSEVVRASGVMRGLDSDRTRLASLRVAATNQSIAAQADQFDRDADTAVAEGRYDDARALVQRANRLLEEAASVPEAPAIVPADVVADVLSRLDNAMEAEDLARIRAVWTSITPDEVDGLQRFFNAVSDLSVTYRVQDIADQGGRIVATVQITYDFEESDDPLPAPTQIFDLSEVAGTWLIVASEVQG